MALTLCAGLATSGAGSLLVQQTHADEAPTIPYDMLLAQDGMAAVCTAHPNGLLSEGTSSDLKLRIKMGRRPQTEYYYDDRDSSSSPQYRRPAPSGDITWLFAGKDSSANGYVLLVEQPLIGCDNFMTSRTDGYTSKFLPSYTTESSTYYNSEGWKPDTSKGEVGSSSLGTYSGGNYKVYANHWGASTLWKTLKSLYESSTRASKGYFTAKETDVMK